MGRRDHTGVNVKQSWEKFNVKVFQARRARWGGSGNVVGASERWGNL